MTSETEYQSIHKRVGESMNGILWTYKTHYKMAEFYEIWGRRIEICSAGGTGILAGAVIWGVNQTWLIFLALVVAFLSLSSTMLGLTSKSKDHYHAGDRYHNLFEDFRDFVELRLNNDSITLEEKVEEYEQLSERQTEINLSTPRTTNRTYASLSEEEVFATMETSSEELDRLIGNKSTSSK